MLVTLRTITKIRSEGALLLHDEERQGGSRLQTLSGRRGCHEPNTGNHHGNSRDGVESLARLTL